MNRDRHTKFLAVIAIVLAVGGLSIGFAALSQTLTIDGTADVQAQNWDIHFENLSAVNDYGTTATVVTAPTIDAETTHIGDFAVNLNAPGDKFSYTFDIVNDGSIDATLSTMTLPTSLGCVSSNVDAVLGATEAAYVCSKLTYTLTYSDGTLLTGNPTLAAGTSKSVILTLEFSSEVDAALLPTASVSVTDLAITLNYIQD